MLSGSPLQAAAVALTGIPDNTCAQPHTFSCSMEESKVGYDQMAHYGTIPHEALFTGFFLTAPTARRWVLEKGQGWCVCIGDVLLCGVHAVPFLWG